VDCIRGIEEVLYRAKSFSAEGDLSFAITLLRHTVFVKPGNGKVRQKLALAFQQLGQRAAIGP
jgi:alkyl sulfatase BDS1-like metallo-beta-lactamase superfamily hydrolase